MPLDLTDVTYFVGRETLLAGRLGKMGPIEESLFAFLSRDAGSATSWFAIRHVDLDGSGRAAVDYRLHEAGALGPPHVGASNDPVRWSAPNITSNVPAMPEESTFVTTTVPLVDSTG